MSYSYTRENPPVGLGFSLKPPKWLRQAVSGVIHRSTVNVPTPTGNVSLTPGEVWDVVKGATVTVGPKKSPVEEAVQKIPGGMNTIALVGIGVLGLLLFKSMSSRRRAA
jgi:hypothetical protein